MIHQGISLCEVGNVLATTRHARAQTLREVGEQTGLSSSTLCRIEAGEPMNIAALQPLADYLLVPIVVRPNGETGR